MIRTLAVSWTPIHDYSKDDGNTAVENASGEIVMGAVQALWQFTLLVSQQNHSDLFLKELDDALKQFYQKKCIFRVQKLSKSALAKVNDLLATESVQLCEQKIHMIRAAIEGLVDWAEKVSTTKHRQFQVRLNRA
jgi:hypothetical protein